MNPSSNPRLRLSPVPHIWLCSSPPYSCIFESCRFFHALAFKKYFVTYIWISYCLDLVAFEPYLKKYHGPRGLQGLMFSIEYYIVEIHSYYFGIGIIAYYHYCILFYCVKISQTVHVPIHGCAHSILISQAMLLRTTPCMSVSH